MFVALRRIKVKDDWLEPGDPVPVEEGRNYGLMQHLGEIAVAGKDPAATPKKAAKRKQAARGKRQPSEETKGNAAPVTTSVEGAPTNTKTGLGDSRESRSGGSAS